MADTYSYSPIDSASGQIRLLTIKFDVKHAYGHTNINPLVGSMKNCHLPIQSLSRTQRVARSIRVPTFFAVSYVWGEPTRTHEITIDGKKHGITENLYRALRDMQRDALGDTTVWADAICINQDDLAERSDQVLLMRDVYHSAAEVRIWLGPSTEEGKRCMKFIAELTGGVGYAEDPSAGEEVLDETEEKILKAILVPSAAVVRAGYGFGASIVQVTNALSLGNRDDRATMVLDPDGNLSLHQETVEELSKWRPSKRRLNKVKDEDFREIASLMDSTFIQQCPWFERMWVVQELGVAETGAIAYGGGVESWENFLRAVYYLHYNCNAPVANIRKLTGLEKIRLGWNSALRQPLRELIRECRYRRATDPRDKIYSLLGLMGDSRNDLLQPDYTKPVAEVYSQATQHFIIQCESLDPICGWQTLGRDDLPTWVPDYNLNQDLAPSPLVPTDGRESLFAASGYDNRSTYILDTSSIAQWTILSVTGLLIDNIAMHSDPTPEDEPFGSIEQMWHSTVIAAAHLLGEFTKDVAGGLEKISSAVRRYDDHWHSIGRPFTQSLHSTSKVNLSLDDAVKDRLSTSLEDLKIDPDFFDSYLLDAYIQTLVCGRQSTTERLSRENVRTIMSLPVGQSSAIDEIAAFICKAFEAGMRGRSLAITSNGYMGAMPQEVQPGDLVCVLFGCSVPVVLRKRTDQESYQFIGECYLHGFMDAEAIAFQVKGRLKEHSFILS